MTSPDPNRLPLRERVAARRRGDVDPEVARAERRRERRWRVVALILQAIGLGALLVYVWVLVEAGFRVVNIWLVLVPSLIFAIGRGIHLWRSIARKRR